MNDKEKEFWLLLRKMEGEIEAMRAEQAANPSPKTAELLATAEAFVASLKAILHVARDLPEEEKEPPQPGGI